LPPNRNIRTFVRYTRITPVQRRNGGAA